MNKLALLRLTVGIAKTNDNYTYEDFVGEAEFDHLQPYMIGVDEVKKEDMRTQLYKGIDNLLEEMYKKPTQD